MFVSKLIRPNKWFEKVKKYQSRMIPWIRNNNEMGINSNCFKKNAKEKFIHKVFDTSYQVMHTWVIHFVNKIFSIFPIKTFSTHMNGYWILSF